MTRNLSDPCEQQSVQHASRVGIMFDAESSPGVGTTFCFTLPLASLEP